MPKDGVLAQAHVLHSKRDALRASPSYFPRNMCLEAASCHLLNFAMMNYRSSKPHLKLLDRDHRKLGHQLDCCLSIGTRGI